MATQRKGMNPGDQQHQENVERGQVATHEDERAYQVVFRAAAQPPRVDITPGFADRVMQRIAAREAAYTHREWGWFVAGLSVFVMAAFVSVLLTGFQFKLTFLNPVKGLILLGIMLVIAFQWIDKRWIKPVT